MVDDGTTLDDPLEVVCVFQRLLDQLHGGDLGLFGRGKVKVDAPLRLVDVPFRLLVRDEPHHFLPRAKLHQLHRVLPGQRLVRGLDARRNVCANRVRQRVDERLEEAVWDLIGGRQDLLPTVVVAVTGLATRGTTGGNNGWQQRVATAGEQREMS